MGIYGDHILPHMLNLAMRNAHLSPYRTRVLSRAQGRVLEIGIGSGANLPFYSSQATEVIGIDPHPKLLAMASAKKSEIPAKIVAGSADSIPWEDESFDTVVTTWTLCSVPDPAAALREMRRVLRASGRLLFVEHGLSPDEGMRRWQHRLTPITKQIAGNCHLNRPMAVLIRDAGFAIEQIANSYMPGPKPMTYMYEGSARRDA